ncbi:MAG: family 78 glycoside hydrolase catalytic domain [Clostridia bacterium]|nr:family 78 glycoside hydrolase catalytic domain [Clostridia bacterium]
MKNPIYSAKFISGDPKWAPVSPYFKKCFALKGEVKRAKLSISALGVFEAFINGERVGRDYMTPGWTNYKKRVLYLEYDVTEMLGCDNELLVGVGHGWFASRGGFIDTKEGMYGSYPALILALEIEYSGGGHELILSDESFDVARSPVLFSGIYDGETFDARITPEFSEKARVYDYDHSTLFPFDGTPTREIETVGVKEVIFTPKGECVLDFGQEITGNIQFVIKGSEAGRVVSIDCAEILDKDGNFYRDNYRTALSRITYTTKEGWQTYKAHYTFFGFRYLRLNDWCEEVRPENFTAIVMHSDMERTAFFKCSNEKINKLYSNIIWGQRDNFLDIPTDCPQRDERLGWTGDAQVFARTASINYDTEKFYTKWLRDAMSEQFEDGGLPYVIPDALRKDCKNGAAWSDFACVIPWELYMAYGNKALLREHLPLMKKWVNYVYNCPGKKYLWQNGKHFGDWLGLDAPAGSYRGSTNEELIASAYFYLCTTLLTKALDALGMKSDRYRNMAKRIKSNYLKTYVKRGRLISDTQTAHVLTLHFGLVDGEPALRESLAKRLVGLIEENGYALTTGFVGTPHLLDTLTEIGRSDLAYKLLLREEYPGWLFSVKMGATTIWEHWDGMREDGSVWSTDMNSFNHYAYGSVASWFYGTILGIRPTAPKYESFDLCPIPCRELGSAKARINTRSGDITSAWAYEGEFVRYDFTVPEGSVATVKLIDGKEERLGGGSYVRWTRAAD